MKTLRKHIRYGFFLYIACLLPCYGFSEETIIEQNLQETQREEYHQRQFDEEQFDRFRSDSAYDYSIKRGEGTTIWQRIKSWIGWFLNLLFNSPGSGTTIKAIFYILIVGAIIFSLLKLLNANPSTIFNSSNNQSIPYTVAEENIHEINFDEEIDKAVNNQDYRLATRLFYLRSLKYLTDSGQIHWETGKTNSDYYYELNPGALRTSFSSLGHMFEYAWYGGFEVDRPILSRVRQLYDEIRSVSGSESARDE